eukprot:CAMPEP_0197451804 /NCGR_PEP_ID=MMETSP1175-20131217/30178_1 /TAXON_ID=1003142 /ORGANISM="Triceratium dubium, Strain CCMP147" /LENGTH=42 /DNA_ID= /DNA_START= /DNA_END= /DNA_ORIENTATION=
MTSVSHACTIEGSPSVDMSLAMTILASSTFRTMVTSGTAASS